MSDAPASPAWNGRAPEPAPRAPLWRQAWGWARIAALALATAAALGLYASCKAVERVFPRFDGRWRVQTGWARLAARMLGLRVRRVGRPMREGGALVSNHVSWTDIIVLRAAARVTFVAKAEVASWPGVGLIARITDTVFVERRRAAARRQEAELRARMRRGERLVFFPEGTSTDGLRVLPFKSTLFAAFLSDELRAHVRVQPVTLAYRPDPASGLPAHFFGWWGDMDMLSHLKALCMLRHGGQVTVMFHQPVRAADFDDRKRLARICHEEVLAGLRQALPDAPEPIADR
ncbi:lysophospholipid acyltransferase family protein [Oceanicella actignis]|uniref:1-acyl-sn-glycerol-3-phosphate acyltransferase n=1 Tax=Oceanicella actignis TaxID=1189325 RepID=A0A1M7RUE1_9RHOB|nr:lysophospholipid acyltransferase family protein [Oceanicella actignis]SET04100.1 lyso-ornithine lipid acyltransferase [Oceanicella actignis]SHN49642.1 1-acyl-sn-glycerol-3-phosphate acyltransferase [Oceanicella actignis]